MSKSLKLIVEALLFASDKPLTAKDIHSVLPDVPVPEIADALKVLKFEFESIGRSFVLKEVADAFQFRSHAEYGPYILAMYQSSPGRLSRAALETLAIVAYKQPVLRQEVERLRGVDSGGILKVLLEKELIRIVGRKNLPGRPLIYGTTKKFLEVFDLKDLDSLPKVKEIKALGSDELEQGPQTQTELKKEGSPADGQETREGAAPAVEAGTGPTEEAHDSVPQTGDGPDQEGRETPEADAGPHEKAADGGPQAGPLPDEEAADRTPDGALQPDASKSEAE